MIDPASAAKAYATAAKSLAARPEPQALTGPQGGFGDLLQSALHSMSQTGAASEMRASEVAAGRGDIVNLVTAVAESEVAIESLVTVRDRVISAYQEILNMPI